VTLTVGEARALLEALRVWDEDVSTGSSEPGWHSHVSDADGNELTIAVEPAERAG
jgi:hypothetical protein